MDFTITDEQRAFVDTVRKVCQKEFMPRAIKYLDGSWPAENMKRPAEIGVLGMSIPQEYGGSGMSTLDAVLVLEEIGKVCYVTAMGALGEVGAQSRIIATYAPESIKQQILPLVVSGDAMLAICLTEPDTGTDVPNYRTNQIHASAQGVRQKHRRISGHALESRRHDDSDRSRPRAAVSRGGVGQAVS